MEAGKVNQFSEMFLMPHISTVQNTVADQSPINTDKNNSFKNELELRADTNQKSDQTKFTNETNSSIERKDDREKLEERLYNEDKKLNDHKNKKTQEAKQKEDSNKDGKHSNNKLNEKDINNNEKKNASPEQKNPLKDRIEEIKEGIIKNEIANKQIKEKITNIKLSSTQKTGTETSAEKLLFQQTEENNQILKKPKINKTDIGKHIENKFKNITNSKKNDIEPKTDQISKTEKEVSPKEKITLIKNESIKESPISSNFTLNLEKEIASSEIKLDKAGISRQLLEQYQEISNKILNKVNNVMNYLATKGGETITIKLQPPELGKIQIELVMKDNTINAKINTENIAIKEIIMTNLDQLKSGIENNGFNINKLEVEIGGFKNFFSKESQNFSNKNKDGQKDHNSRGSSFNNSAEVINSPLNPYTFFVGRSVNMLV